MVLDIHPWTKYEMARLRDEERLLRARAAMHVAEARKYGADESAEARSRTAFAWIQRMRRREVASGPAPAGTGAV